MGTESYFIYIKADETGISPDNLRTFDKKRFGVNRCTFQEALLKEWAKENGLQIDIVDISSFSRDEFLKKLAGEELDAIVTMDMLRGEEDCVPVCSIGSSDYYFAVSKDHPKLLDEHQTIRIGYRNDYLPFCDTNQDGGGVNGGIG